MNSEEKESALVAAIKARDLPKVRQLVEENKGVVTGPGPFNQALLNLAAASSTIDIVRYLVELGARPNEFTLSAAITSGSVYMLQLFRNACEWRTRDFLAAFNSPEDEIRKYAFEVASDDGWFEDRIFMKDHHGSAYHEILSAARQSLVHLPDGILNDILSVLKENGETRVLYTVPDGEPRLTWLHGFIRERNSRSFAIVWDIVHVHLFDGYRHADLDQFSDKKDVEDLFYAAITYGCDEIFYLMLAYALPHFDRCLEVARSCGNRAMFDYLSKYVTPI